MEKELAQLVEKLQKAFASRLISVVLYGSGAAGERHPGFSDFNILCVLTEIGTKELSAGESIFRWWREQGSPAPLLLTESELTAGSDTFAIEFHDIRENHQLLFGKDVVSALVVGDSFYRAQVEHELRAKLLRLRQKACGMFSEEDLLRRMLVDSLSTFCVLFRHALAMSGHPAPLKKREIIQRAQEHFGIDAAPFEKLLDVREDRIKARDLQPAHLLASYLKGISVVIDAVDRLEK
jgi:hypothetical protein